MRCTKRYDRPLWGWLIEAAVVRSWPKAAARWYAVGSCPWHGAPVGPAYAAWMPGGPGQNEGARLRNDQAPGGEQGEGALTQSTLSSNGSSVDTPVTTFSGDSSAMLDMLLLKVAML